MTQSVQLEDAAVRIRTLANSDIRQRLGGANEANTRLQLIDEILEILGWSKSEYNPERVTSTGGYTDYLLTLDGQHRLIVEAKRIGLIKPLEKSLQNPDYANSFLYHSCGSEMQDLLEQCRRYCSDCGVLYAVATTGDIWIILVGFRSGLEWGKLRSFVFHSLEDIVLRFAEFYSLISREAVKHNSLEEKFGSMVLVKPSTAVRPSDYDLSIPAIGTVPDRSIIEAYFDHFMSDITRPDKQDMLEHCYVKTHELNEFSHDLQKLLEYDTVLDEQDRPLENIDEEKLATVLDIQQDSGNPRTVLLVGNIGVGKSTFVHRFLYNNKARMRKSICAVIDLINWVGVDTPPDRAEEQFLAKSVLEELAKIFRDRFDPYDPAVLRGCFEVQLNRFGQQRKRLHQQNPDEYDLREEEHLLELSKNCYDHLIGYVRYTRKKGNKVWITFDNVDRGSEGHQKFVYSFAHRLSSDSRCATLITMREDTYLEAQDAGFLDVRKSDVVYRINAPEFKQIVSKRRKFVDKLLEQNLLPKTLRQYTHLVFLLNWHIKHLVLSNDDKVRLLVTTFSLNNVRYALSLLRDYYTSYHSSFHEFYETNHGREDLVTTELLAGKDELTRFVQALMLDGSWTYRKASSEVFNVFSVDQLEQGSHFLILRVLAYLSLESKSTATGTIKHERLASDFVFLGHPRHHVDNAVRKLLYAGLIVSPKLPASYLKEQKVEIPDPLPRDLKVALSAKGYFYLHVLASHPYYLTRVGENTVWYDEGLSKLYVRCLEESYEAQIDYNRSDSLQATDAKDTFLQYLRRSLLEEYETSNTRYVTREWARFVADTVERKIFGKPVTQSVYVTEIEGVADPQRVAAGQRAHVHSPLHVIGKNFQNREGVHQLQLFSSEFNFERAILDAYEGVGSLPDNLFYQKSRNVVRVLWALQIAFRAGLGSIRAADICTIIKVYGKESLTLQNLAKFFRTQRHSGEYIHLWKEGPQGSFRISNAGSDLLLTLLNGQKSEVH